VATTGSGVGAAASIDTGDGVMYSRSSTRFAEVIDGLSNTGCFSEQTLGVGGLPSSPAGGPPLFPDGEVLELSLGTPATDADCVFSAGGARWSGIRGAKWMNGHYGDTLYNHYYPPNSQQFDCGNLFHNYGLTAARSRHEGGVNLLLCDGAVRFISESLNLAIWHGLATRDRQEVLEGF
jgi:prepilin-type processing-associated H-X9-DG protein